MSLGTMAMKVYFMDRAPKLKIYSFGDTWGLKSLKVGYRQLNNFICQIMNRIYDF